MSGWSTLFVVIGIGACILALLGLVYGIALTISMISLALTCFCIASLYSAVGRIEQNTKQILDQLKKSE